MEKCYAGTETDTAAQTRSVVGNLVEIVVMIDYLKYRSDTGGLIFIFDPDDPQAHATDFFDGKGDRCDHFASFLALKNSHVNGGEINEFCRRRKERDGQRSMIPDIITHDGGLREFYEIKPETTSGTRDGRIKIRNFCELSASHGLPYIAFSGNNPVPKGDRYDPNRKPVFWWGQLSGIPAQVSLRWRKTESSLVQYKFCVEVNSETVNETLFLLCVKMAVVALIVSEGAMLGALAALAAWYLQALTSPLSGSVGSGGNNQSSNVKYIQRLLNSWLVPRGLTALKVDGDAGPKTNGAIEVFQRAETPAWADSRIEPGRNTIKRLEELFITTLFGGSDSNITDPDTRRTWMDDQQYATFLVTPGNQDPEPAPGEPDPLPIDLASVAIASLQEILDQFHDADLGVNI